MIRAPPHLERLHGLEDALGKVLVDPRGLEILEQFRSRVQTAISSLLVANEQKVKVACEASAAALDNVALQEFVRALESATVVEADISRFASLFEKAGAVDFFGNAYSRTVQVSRAYASLRSNLKQEDKTVVDLTSQDFMFVSCGLAQCFLKGDKKVAVEQFCKHSLTAEQRRSIPKGLSVIAQSAWQGFNTLRRKEAS